ncbi:MAG: hypothetical protein HY824_05110 [Acidobacteria bacterium]|nr:hypothetical protein [Acidobacteriota bacterium]
MTTAARNLSARQWRRAHARARHEWKRLTEAVKDALHAVGRVQEAAGNAGAQAYRTAVRTARRPARELQGRRRDLADQWAWNRVEWDAEREIGTTVYGDHPVILGPWLAEVGYEVLYWIPFLQWVRVAYQLDPARVVAVSRGGVASWYSGVAGRYAEIWDVMAPEEFAARNAARAEFKQSAPSPLDRELVERVTWTLGLRGARVLHPSLLFRLFRLFWSGHRPMGFVDAHTRFTLHAPPQAIDRGRLPAEYVAVKLYEARALPATPAQRAQVTALVQALAERTPVVLLDTGLAVDDHADYSLGSGGRIISARDLMEPRTNLGVQTEIVAHARGYVGTCGSITWLAPRLGIDTTALYADPEFLQNHLAVALRTSARLEGAGRFMPIDLRGLPA